jgi:hypothetical protein
MMVEPLDSLPRGNLMKIFDEEPVGDYAYANLSFRELTQRLGCSGHWRQTTKELTLGYRKSVECLITAGSLVDSPLR